jgi:hypothetical protein
VQFGAVQCSSVQFSAVQCSAVQFSSVQFLSPLGLSVERTNLAGRHRLRYGSLTRSLATIERRGCFELDGECPLFLLPFEYRVGPSTLSIVRVQSSLSTLQADLYSL